MFGTFDGRPLGWRKFKTLLSGIPPESALWPNHDRTASEIEDSSWWQTELDRAVGRVTPQNPRRMTLDQAMASGVLGSLKGR